MFYFYCDYWNWNKNELRANEVLYSTNLVKQLWPSSSFSLQEIKNLPVLHFFPAIKPHWNQIESQHAYLFEPVVNPVLTFLLSVLLNAKSHIYVIDGKTVENYKHREQICKYSNKSYVFMVEADFFLLLSLSVLCRD